MTTAENRNQAAEENGGGVSIGELSQWQLVRRRFKRHKLAVFESGLRRMKRSSQLSIGHTRPFAQA